MKRKSILAWVLSGLAALIMLQSLFFKFSAAPESIYIFSKIGLEPVGRIGIGIAELIVGILLLIPRTTWLGAIGGLGLMAGAIGMHLTSLGIEVQGDGGQLFFMAIGVFVACAVLLYLYRGQLQAFLGRQVVRV